MAKRTVITPDASTDVAHVDSIQKQLVSSQEGMRAETQDKVGNAVDQALTTAFRESDRNRAAIKTLPSFGSLLALQTVLEDKFGSEVARALTTAFRESDRNRAAIKTLPSFGSLLAVQAGLEDKIGSEVAQALTAAQRESDRNRAAIKALPSFGSLLSVQADLEDSVGKASADLLQQLHTEIAAQEASSRASALNGDIAMIATVGGDQDISKAVFDPGGETIDVIVELRDSAPQKASQTITATANYADTETVEYGGKTYTFQVTLTDVDGNVQVGSDLEESLSNLFAAGTLGAGAGTAYAASTTAHPNSTPVAVSDTALRAEANDAGTAGNSLTTTETAANASWGDTTMAGGTALVLDANGQVHNWADRRSLTTGGSGIVLAGGATTTPAPTITGSKIDIAKGRMIYTLNWPSGTYVVTETPTVTLDPAAELGAALVPALSVVPPLVLTYTVVD